LRHQVGGADVFGDQARHLVRLSHLPHVSLRVVPMGVMAAPVTAGSFTLLTFAEYRTAVHREDEHSDVYLDDPAEVQDYRRIVGRLHDVALNRAASRAMITALAPHPTSLD
jgi:hypothetical protein